MTCNHCSAVSNEAAKAVGAPEVEATWAENREHPRFCPTCHGFLRRDGGCTKCEAKQAHSFSGDRVFDTGHYPLQPLEVTRLHECLDRARNMVSHLANGLNDPSGWVVDAEEVLAKDRFTLNNVDPKIEAEMASLTSSLRRAHDIIGEAIVTVMSGQDDPELRNRANQFLEYSRYRIEPVDEKTFLKSSLAITDVFFGEAATIIPSNPEHRSLLDKADALAAIKVNGMPQGELREIVETVFERMRGAWWSSQKRLQYARQIDALVQGQPIFRGGGYGDDAVRSPGEILRFEAEELGNEAQLEAAARQLGVEPDEVCDHLDRRYCYAQWGATCEEALTNYAGGVAEAVGMMGLPADARRIVDIPDGTLWAWGSTSPSGEMNL